MTIKEEFIQWFLNNKGDKYQSVSENVIRNDILQSKELLDRDIFEVSEKNFRNIIRYIEDELYKKIPHLMSIVVLLTIGQEQFLVKKTMLDF